jgi:hypothetical protein
VTEECLQQVSRINIRNIPYIAVIPLNESGLNVTTAMLLLRLADAVDHLITTYSRIETELKNH